MKVRNLSDGKWDILRVHVLLDIDLHRNSVPAATQTLSCNHSAKTMRPVSEIQRLCLHHNIEVDNLYWCRRFDQMVKHDIVKDWDICQ